MTFNKIFTRSHTSSMDIVSVSENKDGSVQINIHNDRSHGDRTFSLSPKDALNVINEIAAVLEKENGLAPSSL